MNEMFKNQSFSKVINSTTQVPVSNTQSIITTYLKKNQQYMCKRVMHALGQKVLNYCRDHNIQKRQKIEDYIYDFMKLLMDWLQKGDSIKLKEKQGNENIQKLKKQLKKNLKLLRQSQERVERRDNKINKMEKLMSNFYQKLCENQREQNIKITENNLANQKALSIAKTGKVRLIHKLVNKLLTQIIDDTVNKNRQRNAVFLRQVTNPLIEQINQLRNQRDKLKDISIGLCKQIQQKDKHINRLKSKQQKELRKQHKSRNIMRQQTRYLIQISNWYIRLQKEHNRVERDTMAESINKQKIACLHQLLNMQYNENRRLRAICEWAQQQQIRAQEQHLLAQQKCDSLSNSIKAEQQSSNLIIAQLNAQIQAKQIEIQEYKDRVARIDEYARQIQYKQQTIGSIAKELACSNAVREQQGRRLAEAIASSRRIEQAGHEQVGRLNIMYTAMLRSKDEEIAKINAQSSNASNTLLRRHQQQNIRHTQEYIHKQVQTYPQPQPYTQIPHILTHQQQTNTTPPQATASSTNTQSLIGVGRGRGMGMGVWTQGKQLESKCAKYSSTYSITILNMVKETCDISTFTQHMHMHMQQHKQQEQEQQIVSQYGFMDKQAGVQSAWDRGIQTSITEQQQCQWQSSSQQSQYVYQMDMGTQYQVSDIGQQYQLPYTQQYSTYNTNTNNNTIITINKNNNNKYIEQEQQQPTFATYTSQHNNTMTYNEANAHDDTYNNNNCDQWGNHRQITDSSMENNSSFLLHNYQTHGGVLHHTDRVKSDTSTQTIQVQSSQTILHYIQQIQHLQDINNSLSCQSVHHQQQIQHLASRIINMQQQLSMQQMSHQATSRRHQQLKHQHGTACIQLSQYKHRLMALMQEHQRVLHRHQQQVSSYENTVEQLGSKVEEYRTQNQHMTRYNQQLLETIQYANSLFSGGTPTNTTAKHKQGCSITKQINNTHSSATRNYTESTQQQSPYPYQHQHGHEHENKYYESDKSDKSEEEGLLISRYQCDKDQQLSSSDKYDHHTTHVPKDISHLYHQLHINRDSVSRLLAEFVNSQNRQDNKIAAFTTLVSMLNPNNQLKEKFQNFVKLKKIKNTIKPNENDFHMREGIEKYDKSQDIQDKLYRFFTQN